MADALPSVVEFAKLAAKLGENRALVKALEEALSELEFHGRETSGERELIARLEDLLTASESCIQNLRTATGENEAAQQVLQLRDALEDVDWDIAATARQSLEKEVEDRTKSLQPYSERTEECEKLFTEAYAELEAANRQGVRLASEAKYVGGTLEHLKKVKLALASKVYRDVPRLFNIAESGMSQALTTLGAPLSKKEDLPACLEKIRERVKASRPFSAQADLLLLHSRTGDCVEYTVLLRTPSRPGTHGVNIQGSSTLVEQDRAEFGQKVQSVGQAIQTGAMRGASALPLDTLAEPAQQNAEEQIKDLGDRVCRLVIPEDMQRYLPENPSSVTITTNDLQLPWELMCFGDKILCLEQPVSRMPMGYAIPKRVEQRAMPRDEKRFLLLWSDPEGNLTYVRKEIESIAKALKGEAGTEVEVVESVTGRQLNDILLKSEQYDVVHYAGHAKFDQTRPEQSSLIVHPSGPAREGLRYERFFAQKVRRLLKGQPLVFLNACETGSTAPEKQEEYSLRTPAEGLASAFVYGGALGCVGSLWPVQDEYAAEFAIHFYRRLLDGEALGEAMRQARLKIKSKYPRSATWATFVLYGDPTFRL